MGRLFKRTGNRNPKLIGSDNYLLNEAIPEAAGAVLGPGSKRFVEAVFAPLRTLACIIILEHCYWPV
ncbi:hypothetical protein AUI06_08990 [archaeon 13_2_20CM_2_52_21]|nr:MAG: hypothetical protein AUI06_08990 [archaeon 13_2_20CM_2_52_21]